MITNHQSPITNRRSHALSRLEPQITHGRALTVDSVSIAYSWWRRPSRELLVIAPGFWRTRLARENRFLAGHFLRRGYDVAMLDFRGHGDSGGSYGFGASETADFSAVVDLLVGQEKPYSRFAVLGLSLGGSIAAEALAGRPDLPCRALALISSPADVQSVRPRLWKPGAWRQVSLKSAVRMPRLSPRRLFSRKLQAERAVSRLSMPKLIVSAAGDWLVDPSHAQRLARSAASPVEAVHLDLPGSLHGDALVRFVPLKILRVLTRWFERNAPP